MVNRGGSADNSFDHPLPKAVVSVYGFGCLAFLHLFELVLLVIDEGQSAVAGDVSVVIVAEGPWVQPPGYTRKYIGSRKITVALADAVDIPGKPVPDIVISVDKRPIPSLALVSLFRSSYVNIWLYWDCPCDGRNIAVIVIVILALPLLSWVRERYAVALPRLIVHNST